jgi:hypothetical protein
VITGLTGTPASEENIKGHINSLSKEQNSKCKVLHVYCFHTTAKLKKWKWNQ